MAEERGFWDRVFSGPEKVTGAEDPWLERWRDVLDAHRGLPVLDLGCGAGHETEALTRWGHRVIAADLSAKALELTRRRAPGAEIRNLDLARLLPFPDAHFGVIVAGLSLHYFPWRRTEGIIKEVRRCLVPGGHLLARLNSTRDAYYAAAEKVEVETNFYLVYNRPKRLFDRKDVDALFAPAWTLEHASERTTTRYGAKKTCWEIVARSRPEETGERLRAKRPVPRAR